MLPKLEIEKKITKLEQYVSCLSHIYILVNKIILKIEQFLCFVNCKRKAIHSLNNKNHNM